MPAPLSVHAYSLSRPRPRRAPLQNPYDALSQQEFDAWIGGITSTLRRALGQDDEELQPRQHGKSPEIESSDGLSRYRFLAGDESDDEPAEDSFAELKARRKGKARDPREGPGLGNGDRSQPIEVVSSDEEDAQEVELSMLSTAQDEESDSPDDEEDDARSYSEEEEEEYSWERGQSSSQILPPPRQARVELEEEYQDEGEEEYEGGERGPYQEYEGEEEEYDEEEERRFPQIASDEVIEIVDSDDEQEAVVRPPPRQAAEADEVDNDYDDYNEDEDQDNYQESYRIGTSHLARPDHGFIRRPREYAEEEEQEGIVEQEHKIIQDGDEMEEIQPVDADTSFPPKASLSPAESNRPVELPDPWSGPRIYAEDFYSGGDIRVSPDVNVDVHHIGPMDAEHVEDVDTVALREEDEDLDIVQPINQDTSFPPQQKETTEIDVDLPDPWEGPKTYAEDFYSGGDLRLPPGGQPNAHYMGPTDVDYIEEVEPDIVVEVDVSDSDKVQPLSEDTAFPPLLEQEEEEREPPVELPDPWVGPRTYAEDFYSGGDIRPVLGHQIDPAILLGTADADDSIDKFLTPGVTTPNQSEERTSVDGDVPEEVVEQGEEEAEERQIIQPPNSQIVPTAASASRRNLPIPADADIINIDDSDEEEEEDDRDIGIAASSDVGDDEELDLMYPEFDEPHQEDAPVEEEIHEREETEEVDELEEDDIVPPPTLAVEADQDTTAAQEQPVEDIYGVEAEDFAEDERRPAEPEIHVIEDEDESEEQEVVPEERHEPADARTSLPLISEPRLPEIPDDRSVADRAASIEIVEEDDVDQLQDDEARYILPTEVVEPETASEYTVDEGSVLDEVVSAETAETEVEVPVPAPSPPKESERTPELENTTVAVVVEEEIKEQRNIDEDEDDDMYVDEPLVERSTEEVVAPVVVEPIEIEEQQQEQIPIEEVASEVLVDVDVQEDDVDVDSIQVVEESFPSVPEMVDNMPDVEIQDIESTLQPEQEQVAEEAEDVPVQAFDHSISVAATSTLPHGQLPTPPSEGSRYIPLPPVGEGEETVQPPSHEKKYHSEIEDTDIPQSALADTTDGEMVLDTSSHEAIGYSVEEVDEGYTDDDADGEYEDQEHDISLMSVASASDMIRRWDEEWDGPPDFEEPVTEGRLTEEPPEREMSLGVISITSEAAAAFQEEGLEVADGLSPAEGAVQLVQEEEEKEIPSVEPEMVQEEAPLPEVGLTSAADVPSLQNEVVLEEEVQDVPTIPETLATDVAPFEDITRVEDPADEGPDFIETDKVTTTDLPPVSTTNEVSLADEPASGPTESDQLAPTELLAVQEIEAAAEPILEEATPALNTDAIADSAKEIVVSVPIADSDFGWAAIPDPPMSITADPNVPDPVDHSAEGPSPMTLPVDTDEPTMTVQSPPAMAETVEETAPTSVSIPLSSDSVTQPGDTGPSDALSVVARALRQTDGLFTPAEPADGIPSGEQLDDKHSRALTHLAQAFFWPGSPPAYFGSPAFGNTSGTSTPNKAQPSLADIPPALRVGAQPPLIPDPNSGAKQDVFGNVQNADGSSGSETKFANVLPSPTSTLPGASSSIMSVPLTRRPTDPHILSADPYPYCLSTPGAPLYFGPEKASGETTDKGEGTSPEKASARESTSQGGSPKQSSKRKREASSQRGKGRKSTKAERRKSQASKDVEPEALGDETIVVKPRPKEKERAKDLGPAKRFPSELSQGSHSSSGASLARQVLKPTSRASSVASTAPSVGTQPSPTVNKPHILPRPPQPPQATLLHAHGSRRKALTQAMSQSSLKVQTKKPQLTRVPNTSRNIQPPPSTPTHATASVVPSPTATAPTVPSASAPSVSTSSTPAPAEHVDLPTPAEKVTHSPARQMSLPSLPSSAVTRSTRSHCRYHRISLPKEEGGPRVCFLVPGCSLNDKELMEEEEIEDHGDATQEDSQRMISDIESLGFSLELIGVMRQLVGLDILREQEVFYLPQPGEEVTVQRRYFPRPSTSSRSGVAKDSSSYAGSPDYSGSLRSPVSNRPPDSTSTSFSVIRRLVDSERGSTVASTDTESEATDGEDGPASKRARPSPPDEQGIMGPPSTQLTDKKKQKGRRSKKVDQTYKPEAEPGKGSDEEQSSSRKRRKSTIARGVKRTRTSEVVLAPEGEEREFKKLKSHSTAPDPVIPQ